ncbi:MAG: hypothetical protein HY699_11395 [Deltaproteobacteria bacterium]|nr:hypothetical protein [Deltaproteobacteria bacterium]
MRIPKLSALPAFLRLWFVLFFSYLLIKFVFNLIVLDWIDLRRAALQELLVLPLGQSVVFWLITWRRRAATTAPPPTV